MKIQMNGPDRLTTILGLTPLSQDCSTSFGLLTCSASFSLSACPHDRSCYTATVSTYDAYDASNNTIPPGANLLSITEDIRFAVRTGQDNSVGFTLSAVPAKVTAEAANSSSTVTGDSIALTGPGAHPFYARAYDAAGDLITGLGAPSFSVIPSPAPGLAVATPAPAARNFSLTPPTDLTLWQPTVQVTLSASFPAGETDGCAQAGASCSAQYNVQVPEPLGQFQSYTLPTSPYEVSEVSQLIAAPDGNLWMSGTLSSAGVSVGGLIRMDTTGNAQCYPVSQVAWINDVAVSPSGNGLIFPAYAQYTVSALGMSTFNGAITLGPQVSPEIDWNVASGGDGNVYAANGGAGITKLDASGNFIASYADSHGPTEFAAAPSALWFTDNGAGYVGKITTDGTITEFNVGGNPNHPVLGSDGNIWFVSSNTTTLTKISAEGLTTSFTFGSGNFSALVKASDGTFWIGAGSALLHVSAGGSLLRTYVLPAQYGANAIFVAQGSDGRIWYTASNRMIVAMTP